MYIRNTTDIIPNWSDICSTADIPELAEIRLCGLTKDLKTDEEYYNER